MSRQITRSYLERRYWLATLAMLLVLAITVGIGSLQLSSLQNNARYSAAFVELAESTNDVERDLLRLESSRQDPSASAAETAPTENLRDSIVALAEVYTALRLSDPDADDEVGNVEEADENELVTELALDKLALAERYGLASRGMPRELVELWENEDHEETAETHREDAADIEPSAEEQDLMEENIGTFLGLAIDVERQASKEGALTLSSVLAASNHFETAIRPALDELTFAIRASADRTAKTALYALALGAIICAIAAVAIAVFLFRPMVTAVVDYQSALVSERDRAIASSRAKKDFLAVMSHELRTPMNGILGFANLALRTDLTATQRDYVETMKSSGENLLDLLNDILDLSKIEAGSLETEPHRFSLHETIDSAVQLMSAQAFEKRLEVTHYVDADLPTELCGDSGLIRKLVLNLVGNAVKFTEEGGIAIQAMKSDGPTSATSGQWVEISVRDTGIGIAEEKHRLIFDRFAQADGSTQRLYEGTGLGLAICKEIAELMDGRIWVESEVGSGSTFRVLLRLDHVDPAAPSQREFSGHDLSGARILIVDDNALNRRIATLQLTAYGARTHAVQSCEDALRALAEASVDGDPFQICVIDQMMPVTDGLALLRMIRTDDRFASLKTVLSSSAGVRTDKDARQLGFDAAVPKPVNQERLILSISQLLDEDAETSREAELDRALEHSGEGAIDTQTSGCHLLIVEDNVANLKLACLLLEHAGYKVDKAVNGVEAVAAAARFNYSAILMDIRMPVMDGIEASKRIRLLPGARADVPIIAMTADIAEYADTELEEAGMAAVVSKPIDEKKLLTLLSDVAGSKKSNAA